MIGNADAFGIHGNRNNINYLDGLSIRRSSASEHIWSFAADNIHSSTHTINCPCSGDPTSANPPNFVGNNYFCDTYSENGLLWDGKGCTTALSCCNFNTPPWFSMELPVSIEDIEARICPDETSRNEKFLIQLLEIFVQ